MNRAKNKKGDLELCKNFKDKRKFNRCSNDLVETMAITNKNLQTCSKANHSAIQDDCLKKVIRYTSSNKSPLKNCEYFSDKKLVTECKFFLKKLRLIKQTNKKIKKLFPVVAKK